MFRKETCLKLSQVEYALEEYQIRILDGLVRKFGQVGGIFHGISPKDLTSRRARKMRCGNDNFSGSCC